MAQFYRVNSFLSDLAKGSHNFDADIFWLVLSPEGGEPGNANLSIDDLPQFGFPVQDPVLAANNLEGSSHANWWSKIIPNVNLVETPFGATGNNVKLSVVADKVTFKAVNGKVGPFRYYFMVNAKGTPHFRTVCYWDIGSPITLQDGDEFTVKFSAQDLQGTVLRLEPPEA